MPLEHLVLLAMNARLWLNSMGQQLWICFHQVLIFPTEFIQRVQPKKICSQIGLCTFDGTRGVSMGIESVVDESRGRSSGLGHAMCSTCEMTVSWMQHQLMQNQTQDSILTYVNELCDRLPSPTGQSGVD
ncbi:hypothetical protein POM88_031300 [Heracleum sosnowskyi]|uniref:Saposin B-type domain-containing protein n=1 Tax=Heracleum sosnowskyi TaxID=360622 RepID=A0AAD8MJH5_9APIA|nr:hypothetical protein POM88_031300 [Heracleum sosnowskyi]